MEYQRVFNVSFNEVYNFVIDNFSNLSISMTLESDLASNTVSDSVRLIIFERFSWFGNNRVSLSVLLVGNDRQTKVTMVSSGGSQAVFFKFNRVGENNLLNEVINELEKTLG